MRVTIRVGRPRLIVELHQASRLCSRNASVLESAVVGMRLRRSAGVKRVQLARYQPAVAELVATVRATPASGNAPGILVVDSVRSGVANCTDVQGWMWGHGSGEQK